MEKKREFEVGDCYSEDLAMTTPEARINTLESIAHDLKIDSYTKILTDDELAEKREELAEISIHINDIEIEKKEAMDVFKTRLKEPSLIKNDLLNAIKYKAEEKTGQLFLIADHENGFMYVFDDRAICIESRPLRPSEKQTKILTINKAANE